MAYYEPSRDPALPPIHESVRRKRRLGCACGCAVFLLVLLFGIVGATYWLLRPQPPVAKELILPPNAQGFGVVNLSGQDAGLRDLSRYCLRLVETSVSSRPDDSPAAKYGIRTLQTFITQLVSGEAALALVPAATEGTTAKPGEFDILFGFSAANHLGSLIGQALLRGAHGTAGQLTPHQRGAVIKGPSPAPGQTTIHLGWLGNLLLFSSRTDLIQHTIDRVHTTKTAGVDLDLQDLLDQVQLSAPPPGQDFAFALLLKPGVLKGLIGRIFNPKSTTREPPAELTQALAAADFTYDDVQGVTLAGDIVNADSIKFDLRLVMPRPETARKALTALTKAWEQAPEGTATPGEIVIRRDMKTIGSVVSVTVTLSNLRSWIREKTPLGAGLPAAVPAPATPAADAPSAP